MEDIFAMEEEIAKEISENLRLKLTPRKAEPPRQALHRQCRGLSSLFERPVLLGKAN